MPDHQPPMTAGACAYAIILLVMLVCIIGSLIGFFTAAKADKGGFMLAIFVCVATVFVSGAVFKKDKK
jgi:hypothetical protein